MTTEQIVIKAQDLNSRIQNCHSIRRGTSTIGNPENAAKAQVCEFLRQYAGPHSSFLKEAEAATGYTEYMITTLSAILISFIEYLQAGLATNLSPERQAQIDVVSDILAQAQTMLENESFHSGGAAILIGASLEEYLRNWVEHADLATNAMRPGIDSYAKMLLASNLISKQDIKDITSWAGLRNHAAHGEWDMVSDRSRIRLMLEGVNLFMRQSLEKLGQS